MPSGGPRSGKPGTVYSNRSDLSGDASGGSYGDRVNKAEIVRSTPGSPTTSPAAPPPPPGSLGTLTAPTSRPNEPVTTGLTRGPGAGPEAIGQMGATSHNPALWELRAIAARFADDPDVQGIMRIIAEQENRL
jgi:hypothetical protein